MEAKQYAKQAKIQSALVNTNHQRLPVTEQGENVIRAMQRTTNYPERSSPADITSLQGVVGNGAVVKVVPTKAARPQTVLGATNRFVQRGLFDNPLGWLEGKAESATQWVGNKAESAAQWAGNKANNVASWVGDKAGDAESWVGDKAAKIDEIEAEISIILSELKKKIHGVGL